MSLDLRYFHLRNVITECLNIESFEYCYLIPVLAQTAEYWGDAQVASTCNLMARQVQEYFNHAAHVHLYISKNNEYLNDDYSIYGQYHQFLNPIKVENDSNKYDSYVSTNDTFGYIYDSNKPYKTSNTPYSFLNTYEKQVVLQPLGQIDKYIFSLFGQINREVEQKKKTDNARINNSLSCGKILDHNDCLLLLKILRSRKTWKYNKWYPLVSKLTSNHKMLHISRSFMQISKSEESVSNLLTKLINR
jgi:hypothetical protein